MHDRHHACVHRLASALTSAAPFSSPTVEPSYPVDLAIEPFHSDIALDVDVPGRRARGDVIHAVRANREGARSLVLQACALRGLTVRDAGGRELDFRYDGDEVTIAWREPFARGEERRIAVSYEVVEPLSGLHFSGPDALHPERPAWAATDHETERARYWLPCIDYPSVRTTLTFALTGPESATILANGLLVGEEPAGAGRKTSRWKLDYPCPSYLICFAMGDFVKAEDRSVGGRPIAYFGARGRTTPEDLGRSFGKTPAIMEWMEKRLGRPFPFPKYYQFALPHFGGAMENISLVSWDDGLVADAVLHQEIGDLIDVVNVHEMAHSYFGDAVVIRDFAHAWLKESWATYVESCYVEDHLGEDEHRYALFRDAREYMEEADGRYARPIVTRLFDSSWDMYDRHLYPGGAWRLHMLRKELGEAPFWEAVSAYLAENERRVVETDDFRKALERRSGRSLQEFFDRWLHAPGYPKLKVKIRHDAKRDEVVLDVLQEQAQADGGGWPLFVFPLTVAFEVEEGRFERRTFDVERREHTFAFSATKMPLQARVDPDGALLHRLSFSPGEDMLRRQLTNGPDVIARILAAEELAKSGRPGSLRAVAEACHAEPFWGAREAMGSALAATGHGLVVDLLGELIANEKDVRALRTLAEKAGEIRDERVRGALEGLLDRRPTYRVAAAALKALGQQRDAAGLPRLLEAAGTRSYRSIVASGALRGLGQTRSGDAAALLRQRIGYGKEADDAALAAVEGYGEAARWQARPVREQAVDDLAALVRDPRDRIRMAAARALGRIGERAGAAAVEAIAGSVVVQDQPRLRKIAEQLAKGEEPRGALEERIERLEKRCRALEVKLEREGK